MKVALIIIAVFAVLLVVGLIVSSILSNGDGYSRASREAIRIMDMVVIVLVLAVVVGCVFLRQKSIVES